MFVSVGRSLSSWELIEEELANIFAILVGNKAEYPSSEPAVRAYGTVISSQARLNMLSAAATAYFAPDPEAALSFEAETLINQVRGWSGRRNEIAHGRVARLQSRPGYCLIPSLYNTKKHPFGEKPTYVYSSVEINEFNRRFIDLLKRANFYRRILGRAEKPSR